MSPIQHVIATATPSGHTHPNCPKTAPQKPVLPPHKQPNPSPQKFGNFWGTMRPKSWDVQNHKKNNRNRMHTFGGH